jgi:hypothetical protein
MPRGRDALKKKRLSADGETLLSNIEKFDVRVLPYASVN